MTTLNDEEAKVINQGGTPVIVKVNTESSVDSSSDSESSRSGNGSVTSKTSKTGNKEMVERNSSESGDNSDNGGGSSSNSSSSDSDGSAESVKSSKSGKSSQSVKSGGSIESFKSMNVTASAIEVDFNQLPQASVGGEAATLELSKESQGTPATNQKLIKVLESPIIATPCKSLVIIKDSPKVVSKALIVNQIQQVVTGEVVVSANPIDNAKMIKDTGDMITPKRVDVKRKVEANVEAESKVDRKKSRNSTKKAKKKSKDKIKEMEKSVERLEAVIKKVEKEKSLSDQRASKLKKKAERYKKKKSAKVKKAKEQRSESCSSNQSEASPAADKPCTSTRIGKIPDSRRFQRLAMSRTKELGLIKDGRIQAVDYTEAIKRIDTVQFKILPTQAYKWFHRVPGSHLPHITRHLRQFRQRYNTFLRAVAKLFLTLAQAQNQSKAAAVGPEETNVYALLWQYENDLTRAVANVQPNVDEPPTAKKAKIGVADSDVIGANRMNEPGPSNDALNDPPVVDPGKSSRTQKKNDKDRKK